MAPITLPEAGSQHFPRQIVDAIFEDVARESVVQRLARRVNLPESGAMIPVTTEKPTAGWVSEGQRKPVTNAGNTFVYMDRKKLAAIVVFSQEYVRSDPGKLYSNIQPQIREAFATAFDQAALHGTAHDGSAGPFPSHLAQTEQSVQLGTTAKDSGSTYGDIVAGLELLAGQGKKLTGFAVDTKAEPTLLMSTDTSGRPLWLDAPMDETLGGRLIGRPAGLSDGVSGSSDLRILGGNWDKVAYGIGSDISFSVSDQTTVTIDGELTSLWESNLVAIRVEAEYGFVVGDVNAFVRYTAASGGSSGGSE